MNKIPYEEREKTYMNVLIQKGQTHQVLKALEELSECQEALVKYILEKDKLNHLAEEIADATIMLEQLRMIFQCNDLVCQYMDEKIMRLDNSLRPGPFTEDKTESGLLSED